MDLGDPDIRMIRLRYPGRCACGTVLEVGLRAAYDDARRRVICDRCLAERKPPNVTPPPTPPPAGVAGASAVREYERRVAKRDAETASMKRGLRRFIRKHTPPPSSTQVWLKGATGERRVADVIDALAPQDVYALHDRGVPRSRANIDHVAIAASGVYVIDAKNYPGATLAVRREGGWGRPVQETLLVRGRRRNDLLAGLAGQLFSVEAALHGDPELAGLPVRGVLCFLGANFPLFPLTMTVADVPVVGLHGLRRQLLADGELEVELRYRAYCHLAGRLPAN
jgi:hypothetical protein